MVEQVTQIDIPDGAKDIVIFVHGFGVRYDSRGMFTDIKTGLPSGIGTVLIDLNRFSENNVYLSSINGQSVHLLKIFEKVKAKYPKMKVHIVAHSMGCIVASIAKLKADGKVILLFVSHSSPSFRLAKLPDNLTCPSLAPLTSGPLKTTPADIISPSS